MASSLQVDGRAVALEDGDEGRPLLEVLRQRAGALSVKDGCSPQGQCGCCTVLVDGQPRVACVTPTRRVLGRAITTVDGMAPTERARWAEAFVATGASQCGFCTPGIILRLSALAVADRTQDRVGDALLAHLCRCTGWRTIFDAVAALDHLHPVRDLAAAGERATLEGGTVQRVGPDVAIGRGGFADDTAPADALVAVRAADGSWAVADTLAGARAAAGKVQGRRTTLDLGWPVAVPAGDWALTLQTTWVEPGYLEPDASWCRPGGEPASPLANGGAFGGKLASPVADVARRLADEHGRAVRVVLSREDVVRLGPKRPPIAAGVRADGSGALRVVRTPGIAAAIASVAPGLRVEEVDVLGPSTAASVRGAGWIEAAVLLAAAAGTTAVRSPAGATASATISDDGTVRIQVSCGDVLDEVALRSACIGAAHQALGWVRSEGLVVDAAGEVHDLTIRSFGILRARDTPAIEVAIVDGGGPPVNGSDAVLAAVTAAAWAHAGHPSRWPVAP